MQRLTAKEIGDEPVYSTYDDKESNADYHPGISYRQWMIGMALQGILATDEILDKAPGYAIKAVDLTLEQLAKETEPVNPPNETNKPA